MKNNTIHPENPPLNSEEFYDAFISYKRGPIDSEVAKFLLNKLENFHTSWFSKDEDHKIQRIFLDTGEMSAGGDLDHTIRNALITSKYLIVICSPNTPNAAWVNWEIQTFLEYHDNDRSRILPIMTSGEPEEIFPEVLQDSETKQFLIRGADARGSSLKEVLKRIKKNALLELAAPILGVNYDDLKQRKRTHRFQLIAATSACAAVILSIFAAYILWQASQINEQYQNARRNQARYLSSVSLELFQSGEKEKALQTALAILPEDGSKTSVVPEQMYALNTALGVYKSNMFIDYSPAYVGEVENIRNGSLSPEGIYYLALDQYGTAYFLKGDNGKLLSTLSIDELNPRDNSSIQYVLPVSETKACLISNENIYYIDTTTKEVINQINTSHYAPWDESSYALGNNRLAIAGNDAVYIYNLTEGSLEHTLQLNSDDETVHTSYTINALDFNEASNELAIGLSYVYYDAMYPSYSVDKSDSIYTQIAETYFSEQPASGILIYSLEDGYTKTVTTKETSKVLFTNSGHLAAIHITEPSYGTSTNWGNENASYYLSIYDSTYENCLLTSPEYTLLYRDHAGINTGTISENENAYTGLYCWFQGNLLIINLDSLQIISEIAFNSNIHDTVSFDDTRALVSLSEGYVQLITTNSSLARFQVLTLADTITSFEYNSAFDTIIQITNGKLVYSNNTENDAMVSFTSNDVIDAYHSIDAIDYVSTQSYNYRYLTVQQEHHYNTNGIIVYPILSDKPVFQFLTESVNDVINNIGFGETDKTPYLCFTVTTENDVTYFYKINLSTGAIQIKENVTAYETLYFLWDNCISYNSELSLMVVERKKGAVLFDISGDTLIPDAKALLRSKAIDELHISPDNHYVLLTSSNTVSDKYSIYIYDVVNDVLSDTEIVCDMPNTTYSYIPKIVTGQSKPYFAFYNQNGQVDVYDCEKNCLLHSFNVTNSSNFDMVFFNQDQYLITSSNNTITMWDITTGKSIMQYSTAFNGKLIAGNNQHYFALKDSAYVESTLTDSGLNTQPITIFYVDDSMYFYPFADINHGYVSQNMEEICIQTSNRFSYTSIYDYSELKDMADELLDGQTLSDAEKSEYYISE